MCSKGDGSARVKHEVAFSLIPEKKKKKWRFKKKERKKKVALTANQNAYHYAGRPDYSWRAVIIFFFPAFSFPLGFLVVAFVSFVS